MSFLGPFYSLYTEYTHSDAVIKYVQEDIICIHINSPLEDVARVESPSPPQDYVPHAKAFDNKSVLAYTVLLKGNVVKE